MTKLKIALLLFSCALGTLAQNQTSQAQPKIDHFLKPPPDRNFLQQPQLYPSPKEEPSFMSKVASWIFPFGGTNEKPDSAPAETQQRYAPQYLPAPQSPHGYSKQQCNPCNKEPWIPVASTQGHNTVIGFVQQSQLGHQSYAPQSNNYGSPPSSLHNLQPPPPLSQYGAPISSQYGSPPQQPNQNRPLNVHPNYGAPKDQYGQPTNVQSNLGAPPGNYRLPVQYFVPPPPSKQEFQSKYPSFSFKQNDLPPQKFGPPKHGLPLLKPPKAGQAKFKFNPPPHHGPPIPLNFGNNKFPPVTKVPSSLSTNFKPPAANNYPYKNSAPSQLNYDVPLQLPQLNIDYIAPALLPNYQLSSGNGAQSNNHQSNSPPSSYDVPILPIHAINVEQNILSSSGVNSLTSSHGNSHAGNLNKPIPFPGLSFSQVTPLHNSQPFHDNFKLSAYDNLPQHGSKVETHSHNGATVHDVQVIPSIRVADYLASVEHPISVIQSPLVDVIATENIEPRKPEPVTDYGNNGVQLSENPIVVDSHEEDNHAAATAQNTSYHDSEQNQKRHNDKDEAYFANQNVYVNNQPSSPTATNFDVNNVPQIQIESATQNPLSHQFLQQEFSQSSVGSSEGDQNSYKIVQNEPLFTPPPMDYSNWSPSFGSLSTSMVPPPVGEPVWFTATAPGQQITSTTKKPKQVQIIIPYTLNNPPSALHGNIDLLRSNPEHTRESKVQQTLLQAPSISSSASLPLFTQPPTIEDPVWSQYVTDYHQAGSNKVTATLTTVKPTTSVSNIRDLLRKEEQTKETLKNLPFDIISLQKNIDDWTQQEFSNSILNTQKVSTSGKLVPSKIIPSEYLTTQPYNKNEITTVKSLLDAFYDHEPAGSNTKISKVESNETVDANFILTETTSFSTPTTTDAFTTAIPTTLGGSSNNSSATGTQSSVTEAAVTLPIATPRAMWEKLQVSFSPLTKEKIYVVTPQPWKFAPKEINDKLLAITESSRIASTAAKFSVVIQPEGNNRTRGLARDANGGLHIVYSEWPHLINNLITTTTEKPKQTPHPLLGLMDLSSYTPPPNSTVETYGGHSRVITVVTPTSTTKKKSSGLNEKKATTKTVTLLKNNSERLNN